MELLFIRHGKTAGNLRHNYIGCTDEPLCSEGIAEIKQRQYPRTDILFCSPMLRCRQTATLIYPHLEPYIIDNMRECSFGDFENKNYQDLSGEIGYQMWLASNGMADFPGGESRKDFIKRCCLGFKAALEYIKTIPEPLERAVFMIHGGTIMALLSQYTGADYYSFMCQNGNGYRCDFDSELWFKEYRLNAPKPLF